MTEKQIAPAMDVISKFTKYMVEAETPMQARIRVVIACIITAPWFIKEMWDSR